MDYSFPPDFEPAGDEPAVLLPGDELTGYTTEHYRLITTTNLNGLPVYQVVNIQFGIPAAEDHELGRILAKMQELQAELSTAMRKYVPPTLLTLVGDYYEGKDSLH